MPAQWKNAPWTRDGLLHRRLLLLGPGERSASDLATCNGNEKGSFERHFGQLLVETVLGEADLSTAELIVPR
jgi:hypothetical protein